MNQEDNIITIVNDGQNIEQTNYFESPAAKAGYVFLSINAGAFRLLVPDSIAQALVEEIATANEVIISRGAWESQGNRDAFEIMFEDNSDSPYALHISANQAHTLPLASDADKQWVFTMWNSKGKIAEFPSWYRIVNRLPCLAKYQHRKNTTYSKTGGE